MPDERPDTDWDVDPDDLQIIRDALADGLIEYDELPTEHYGRDFEPLVTERQAFKLLVRHIDMMREMGIDAAEWRQRRREDDRKEVEERATAPYQVALLLILVAAVVLVLALCSDHDARAHYEPTQTEHYARDLR